MDRREILRKALAAPLLGLFGMKQGVGGFARIRPMRAAALGSLAQGSVVTQLTADGDMARQELKELATKFSNHAVRLREVASGLREANLTGISLPAVAPPPASIFPSDHGSAYRGDEAFHLVLHLDPRRSPFAAVPPPLPAMQPPVRHSHLDQVAPAHQVS